MVSLRYVLGPLPMIFHNIVSFSIGFCSRPGIEATARLSTHSLWEQAAANSHCVLSNTREPVLFGLKAVAEILTIVCCIPTLNTDVAGISLPKPMALVALRGSYLAGIASMYWYWRPGAGTPLVVQAVDQAATARICAMHARVASHNRVVQPPTLLEVLGIDASRPPFSPPQSHSMPGAPAYEDARQAIVNAVARVAGLDLPADIERAVSGDDPLEALQRSAKVAHAFMVAAVADLLLDDTARYVYMAQFVPALMGPDMRITWDNAKDREGALRSMCPSLVEPRRGGRR